MINRWIYEIAIFHRCIWTFHEIYLWFIDVIQWETKPGGGGGGQGGAITDHIYHYKGVRKIIIYMEYHVLWGINCFTKFIKHALEIKLTKMKILGTTKAVSWQLVREMFPKLHYWLVQAPKIAAITEILLNLLRRVLRNLQLKCNRSPLLQQKIILWVSLSISQIENQ